MGLLAAIFSYSSCYVLLTGLAWYDLRYFILPNILNALLALSFGLFHFFTNWTFLSPLHAMAGAVAGGGLLLIMRFVFNKIMKSEDTIGLGDVKFMAAAGFGLGMPAVFMALSLGAFFGIFHGFLIARAEAKRTGQKPNLGMTNVPAGVGLAIATAVMMLAEFGLWWEHRP